MLSWVAKVGPQLPEPPPTKIEVQKEVKPAATTTTTATTTAPAPKKVTFQDECTTDAPKGGDKSKQEAQDAQPAEGSSSAPGVLAWISSALPQPAVSPKLKRTNSTVTEENTSTSNSENQKGMISWIAQGLEKVVPQPDLKSKESSAAEQTAEVRPVAAAPAAEPVKPPQAAMKEADREDKPEIKPYPPRMMDWIKQGLEKVVPQPEFPVRSNTDAKNKTETPAAAAAAQAKAPEPSAASKPAADSEGSSKAAEQQPKMMDWIVSGIGRIIPQPVQRQDTAKEEVKEKEEVQKRGKGHEPL